MSGRATHCAEAMSKTLNAAELHIALLCPDFVSSFANTQPHPHSSGRLHLQVRSMQRQLMLKAAMPCPHCKFGNAWFFEAVADHVVPAALFPQLPASWQCTDCQTQH